MSGYGLRPVSFGFRDEVGYDVCQKFQGANFDVDTQVYVKCYRLKLRDKEISRW